MNECITKQTHEESSANTSHFSPAASLAAMGLKIRHEAIWTPIEQRVQIPQKTVKYRPIDKLYDAFIALLAGAHGMVEINTRLRTDPGLQIAFGRMGCAEQSVVQQTLDACGKEQVQQLEAALRLIFAQQSRAAHHDYAQDWQILDVDVTGLPCGPKAAFATRGYFAHQRNRRGRQLGRVLATRTQEIVVDQLFEGSKQLNVGLQPLVEAAEQELNLDESRRQRTIIRVDAGAGTQPNLRWLLERGYQVIGKLYSGLYSQRLALNVSHWYPDPRVDAREFGRVSDPLTDSPCALTGVAVRYRQRNQQWKIGVVVCSLPIEQVWALLGWPLDELERADEPQILSAFLTYYDQRGGGVETAFRGDKEGLGLLRRSKKRFEAQQMLTMLNSLVHNVITWARTWLIGDPVSPDPVSPDLVSGDPVPPDLVSDDLVSASTRLSHYGMLRMVRDVFHISGFLVVTPNQQVVQVGLNQESVLAQWCFHPLRRLLAPLHVAVNLDKT